jgi:hypothetical protein
MVLSQRQQKELNSAAQALRKTLQSAFDLNVQSLEQTVNERLSSHGARLSAIEAQLRDCSDRWTLQRSKGRSALRAAEESKKQACKCRAEMVLPTKKLMAVMCVCTCRQ